MENYKTIFSSAQNIAYMAHYKQYRKNNMPYFMHPWRVANKFRDYKLKTIAILHDVFEDTNIDSDYLLKNNIPEDIVEILHILNKNRYSSYELYIKAIKKNNLATSVKIEDILDNLSDFPSKRQILKYAKALQYLLT